MVPIRVHLDRAFFVEALAATAAVTGFQPRLIEKDYYCSVVLQHLAATGLPLVFKGGTCLAKIHIGFFRMSEDLDFTVPVPVDLPRPRRSRLAHAVREVVDAIEAALPGVFLRERLSGANNSTQYSGVLAFRSTLHEDEETIKLEIGLREPTLRDPVRGAVRTLLVNPASGAAAIPEFPVACLAAEEAIAEKIRAALCRRRVAIRDFYDIDQIARGGRIKLSDPVLLELVRSKVAIPGTDRPSVSEARRDALRLQVEAELAPVVLAGDLAAFDLDRAFTAVADVAEALRL